MNNKGADQTVWMLRLVCAFVVHIQQNQVFSRWGSYHPCMWCDNLFDNLFELCTKLLQFYLLQSFARWSAWIVCYNYTPGRRQLKTLSTIDECGSKLIETVFLIAICRQCGDKWQLKTLFLTIFDLRSSIVLAISTAAYPVWIRLNYNISEWNVVYAFFMVPIWDKTKKLMENSME